MQSLLRSSSLDSSDEGPNICIVRATGSILKSADQGIFCAIEGSIRPCGRGSFGRRRR